MLGGRKLIAPLMQAQPAHADRRWACRWSSSPSRCSRNLDVRFQTTIASTLPLSSSIRRAALEEIRSPSQDQLADARGSKSKFVGAEQADEARQGALPVLGTAPDFVGNQRWFNTANGKPLTLNELRGKVVLVDFWTYTCINCIRTLPYLKAWDEKYQDKGLVIVGVHTPEFPFERKSAKNVQDAIDQNEITLPGRPGQRLQDLGCLRQRVLAGAST